MNAVVERSHNPFAGAQQPAAAPAGGAIAQTDQQRAVAEVQAAMMIARMNPRDAIAAMDRILNACSRPTLAEAAVYQYSRGGSDVSGPSIRLAEAIAQQWGNIQFGIRELEQRNGESTVQAFAWDVETNTRREVTFHVPHMRHTKKGAYKLDDPRDVYEMVANQGARRLRACILAVIPGDVIEAAVKQCEMTMRAKADTSPEAMQKMLEAFAAFGVTKEQIERRIQRRIDAIQPAQVVTLKKIYASLRDGMSSPADWFDAEGASKADAADVDGMKAKLAQRQASAAAPSPQPAARAQGEAAAPKPAASTQGGDADLLGDEGQSPEPARSKDELLDMVAQAETADQLDYIRSLNDESLSGADKAAVSRAINSRAEIISRRTQAEGDD